MFLIAMFLPFTGDKHQIQTIVNGSNTSFLYREVFVNVFAQWYCRALGKISLGMNS